MKIADWLTANIKILEDSGISTARLDCQVLLADSLGEDKAYILAHPEFRLTSQQLKVLDKQITKRVQHIPLAVIRGKTEFYGREFVVNEHVLEPRPESETMIDLMIKLKRQAIIDVGTGSGALAITAKLELPSSSVIAVDIDKNCLNTAQVNAKLHNADIKLLKSDLLTKISDAELNGACLLANLPYVPDRFTLNQAAMNEPKLAIFGGQDGLDIYRQLFEQINQRPFRPKYILSESLPFQHQDLIKLAKSFGYEVVNEADFIVVFG